MKRGRPQPVAGYDYAAFCQGIADRDGADCWVRRNVPLEAALRSCDGQLDGHHLLKKTWLKSEFPFGAVFFAPRDHIRAVAGLLNDSRNGILVCRKHHDLIENARIALSADLLPRCVFEFAAELGDRAVARLERDFGAVPVSASGGTK